MYAVCRHNITSSFSVLDKLGVSICRTDEDKEIEVPQLSSMSFARTGVCPSCKFRIFGFLFAFTDLFHSLMFRLFTSLYFRRDTTSSEDWCLIR